MEKLYKFFGLKKPDYNLLSKINKNNLMIKRKLIIGVRGEEELINALKSKDFYILTGIMPSYKRIHLGTLGIISCVKFLESLGKLNVIVVADVEAYLTRNISLEKAKKIAYQYHIPSYLALGLNEKKTVFYFQSENKDLIKIAISAAKNITLSTFKEVYGDYSPQRIYSSTYQIADILFPQLIKPRYGIIPVGVDQDPHLRLVRDYVRKVKDFNFIQPSALYVDTIPSLSGKGKMSKSEPQYAIFLPEEENILKKKIMRAFSGGGATVDEHRKKGANLDIDVCYKILKFIDKSENFEKIVEKYKRGEVLTGEFKQYTYSAISLFMNEFKERFNYFSNKVKKGKINMINSIEELKSYL